MRSDVSKREEAPSSIATAPERRYGAERTSFFNDVRLFAFRYLRRFGGKLEPVDSHRLAGRLQTRLPPELSGPGGRAIIQHIVIEMAGRSNIPIKW